MHKSEIKRFAIWARRTLLQQTAQRAALFGLLPDQMIPAESQSYDKLVVQGQTFGTEEARGYTSLIKRLQHFKAIHNGQHKPAFNALIDEAAYTWFNRLTALRFMEVQGYLSRRVLSSSDGGQDPDLLQQSLQIALQAELPGITTELVDELRHTDDQALYRKLLVAQCNALKPTLPFLFETISDELSLLLPLNLLSPDSVLRRLVSDIPEEDWREVEIIGWMYQYYISERKDEVFATKTQVASADIPAATQLFTPNWIVQYMVQNSLGRLWLEIHPESPLKAKMPYYLDTPSQEPEVQAKIDETKNPNLQPQDLTVMDPACGSGHILVYAFELLTEIYREQGYRDRDIPAMIFEHNLHGLDIDGRAAQLTSFALMMKARSILRDVKGLHPKVMQLQSSRGVGFRDVETFGGLSSEELKPWKQLVEVFLDTDTLGSLIVPPSLDYDYLSMMTNKLKNNPNGFVQSFAWDVEQLLKQANFLYQKYGAVVANPPFMGNNSYSNTMRMFTETNHLLTREELSAVFLERCLKFVLPFGKMGMINQQSWMFLSSYKDFRSHLLSEYSILNMLHLGSRAFSEIGGEVVQTSAFVMSSSLSKSFNSLFIRLTGYKSSDEKELQFLNSKNRYVCKALGFYEIPGTPIAYWISEKLRTVFKFGEFLRNIASPKQGLATGNNDRFLRFWHEIGVCNTSLNCTSSEDALSSKKSWFPNQKGGEFRRWFGNNTYMVNWCNDGTEIKNYGLNFGSRKQLSRPRAGSYYFKPGISWSRISTGLAAFRYVESGQIVGDKGPMVFVSPNSDFLSVLGLLNSKCVNSLLELISPTLGFEIGHLNSIPISLDSIAGFPINISNSAIEISKSDWDSFESSWGFNYHPIVRIAMNVDSDLQIQSCFSAWTEEAETRFHELQGLEVENNKYWIEAYGLQDELTPEVPDEQITVRQADETRDIESLLSYALGCIMGRYSLDQPGLVHAGQAFDSSKHITFSADSDGIVPVNDTSWFEDDLVNQIKLWVKTVFGETHYAENLRYLASVLGAKAKESPEDTLRRYFTTQFMKDHHQVYKKRPIYWLFTSGKKRAFNAYVYLHRYSPDTLGLMRAEYLHPLQLKLETELKHLAGDAANAKRVKVLQDQLAEIQAYDELLKHKAEQRISIDLDDGVAYNYTLFEGLVYEGADLKMADLKAKSQWKRDLLASNA